MKTLDDKRRELREKIAFLTEQIEALTKSRERFQIGLSVLEEDDPSWFPGGYDISALAEVAHNVTAAPLMGAVSSITESATVFFKHYLDTTRSLATSWSPEEHAEELLQSYPIAGSVAQKVIHAVLRHPSGATKPDIKKIIWRQEYDIKDTTIDQTISRMISRGQLNKVRDNAGEYLYEIGERWRSVMIS